MSLLSTFLYGLCAQFVSVWDDNTLRVWLCQGGWGKDRGSGLIHKSYRIAGLYIILGFPIELFRVRVKKIFFFVKIDVIDVMP